MGEERGKGKGTGEDRRGVRKEKRGGRIREGRKKERRKRGRRPRRQNRGETDRARLGNLCLKLVFLRASFRKLSIY